MGHSREIRCTTREEVASEHQVDQLSALGKWINRTSQILPAPQFTEEPSTKAESMQRKGLCIVTAVTLLCSGESKSGRERRRERGSENLHCGQTTVCVDDSNLRPLAEWYHSTWAGACNTVARIRTVRHSPHVGKQHSLNLVKPLRYAATYPATEKRKL